MSAASDVLKHFNLFIDGVGYAGQIEELQLPSLSVQEEDFRAGGMDASIGIDMGMEKMECSFSLTSFSEAAITQFGLANGAQTQMTARGSLESLDGSKKSIVVSMRGKIKKAEPGAFQGGQKVMWKFEASLIYYRFEQQGRVLHEIDVVNMKRVVAGVDQLAEHRANIGI
jgi:uncharacterized protein